MTRHLDWGLQGRTAIVTGGAGAIGRAVAEGFAEAGCRVAVVDLDPGAADAAARGLGSGHRGYGADLSDIAALPALAGRIATDLGTVTVLANVAGLIRRNPDLFTVTEADWDAQYGVNIKALFFLTQAVARGMRDAGTPGAVINYTSQGWMSGGFGGSVVYNSTKGAVTTITRGMARAWAPFGIRVNAVAPGLVDTPMLRGHGSTPEQMEALAGQVPLGRLGVPGDHVGATVFLASDMARYMTGATVNVSGGFLMY
jgi:NAD(P)-dependent dehydrogenase (short-subunit alcohol dehydrogenase family)